MLAKPCTRTRLSGYQKEIQFKRLRSHYKPSFQSEITLSTSLLDKKTNVISEICQKKRKRK